MNTATVKMNSRDRNTDSWIEIERLKKHAAIAVLVPATGLGYSLTPFTDDRTPHKSSWDDIDTPALSPLSLWECIEETNELNRLLRGIRFNVGTGPSEPANVVVAEAESSRFVCEQGSGATKRRAVIGHDPRRAKVTPQSPTERLLDVSGQVRFLKETLSLSVTELAAILDVKRPTIYAWKRGDAIPQQRNADRLALLNQIAKTWRSLSSEPLYRRLRLVFDSGGQTLFGMLKSEELDLTAIQEHLKKLASLPTNRPATIRELAQKHGLPTDPKPNSEGAWEMAVTKRFASDVGTTDEER